MEESNMTIVDDCLLMPKILEKLSGQRDWTDTLENLYGELGESVLKKHPHIKGPEVIEYITDVLKVGQTLGLLKLGTDIVTMTIELPAKSQRSTTSHRQHEDEPEIEYSLEDCEAAVEAFAGKNVAGFPLTKEDIAYIMNGDKSRQRGKSGNRRSSSRNATRSRSRSQRGRSSSRRG